MWMFEVTVGRIKEESTPPPCNTGWSDDQTAEGN